MKIHPFHHIGLTWRTAIAVPLTALLLLLFVAACGGTDTTPAVVIVTATHTPEPVVVVITATFTPSPDTGQPQTEPSATPVPSLSPTIEEPSESVGPAGGDATATLRSTTEVTSTCGASACNAAVTPRPMMPPPITIQR